jgi:hypothetical protein
MVESWIDITVSQKDMYVNLNKMAGSLLTAIRPLLHTHMPLPFEVFKGPDLATQYLCSVSEFGAAIFNLQLFFLQSNEESC